MSPEGAVNLAVSQASSIQSIGGTCESITVGHNPAQLSLTKADITLVTSRPQFLCEHILNKLDTEATCSTSNNEGLPFKQLASALPVRSISSLKGAYLDLQEKSVRHMGGKTKLTKEEQVLEDMIKERKRDIQINKIFNDMDSKKTGTINLEDFIAGYDGVRLSREELVNIFNMVDKDENGTLDIDEFVSILAMPQVELLQDLHRFDNRDVASGFLQVKPSDEAYFGEMLLANGAVEENSFARSNGQHFAMELYESRVASLQRFVAMCVIFHEMGKRVQEFFPRVSCGYLGYRMDQTHSIMQVATTASPVSGDAVRERMETLHLRAKFQTLVRHIEGAWWKCKNRIYNTLMKENSTSGFVVSV